VSGTRTLLLEIGCEEIPARMLPAAAGDLARAVARILDQAKLSHGEPRPLWTPRRLAVLVPDVATETASEEATVTGPPASVAWDGSGQPTGAARGFAQRHGIGVDALTKVETGKGAYAAATILRPSRGVGEVLGELLEKEVRGLSFPKTMRWGSGEHAFVRPVHWLVALAGESALDASLFGIAAGGTSRGHRVLADGPVEIPSADEYVAALEVSGVVAEPEKRRAALSVALAREAEREGGSIVPDEPLLQETADMVEHPGAIAGRFDVRFVEELPREILATCLRHHQRAFSISAGGKTLPSFAVAVNVASDPEGHVRRGNEWVVSGRLEDALFFWREDRRRSLSSRSDALSGITFQRELGTFADKTERVAGLCASLADGCGLDPEDRDRLVRAARLARCDLTTGLVGEFPELQGVVGGLLAAADGENEEVTRAIYHLYQPAGASEELPPTRLGRMLGVADRMDTLSGAFAIGLIPSGSKDPFALRRSAHAAIRLAAAEGTIELVGLAARALEGHEEGPPGLPADRRANGAQDTLVDFLYERFAALAEGEGARYDEIASVREIAAARFLPEDLLRRLEALRRFRESDDFLALATAAKRVRNILAQAEDRGDVPDTSPDEAALELPAERGLGDALGMAAARIDPLTASGDYTAALATLASLRPAVDRFFDDVLVMDEDQGRRTARLGLLARFQGLAHGIVDLSELVVVSRAAG